MGRDVRTTRPKRGVSDTRCGSSGRIRGLRRRENGGRKPQDRASETPDLDTQVQTRPQTNGGSLHNPGRPGVPRSVLWRSVTSAHRPVSHGRTHRRDREGGEGRDSLQGSPDRSPGPEAPLARKTSDTDFFLFGRQDGRDTPLLPPLGSIDPGVSYGRRPSHYFRDRRRGMGCPVKGEH